LRIVSNLKQGNFEKIAMPRPAYSFVTYLMEYAFTFAFASRELPPISVGLCCIVRAMGLGFLGLSVLGVRLRHATDRQTDRHRTSFHNATSYGGRGLLTMQSVARYFKIEWTVVMHSPRSEGGIIKCPRLSVRLSVCLSVCLSVACLDITGEQKGLRSPNLAGWKRLTSEPI